MAGISGSVGSIAVAPVRNFLEGLHTGLRIIDGEVHVRVCRKRVFTGRSLDKR